MRNIKALQTYSQTGRRSSPQCTKETPCNSLICLSVNLAPILQ